MRQTVARAVLLIVAPHRKRFPNCFYAFLVTCDDQADWSPSTIEIRLTSASHNFSAR
jgi:hypothetical protein